MFSGNSRPDVSSRTRWDTFEADVAHTAPTARRPVICRPRARAPRAGELPGNRLPARQHCAGMLAAAELRAAEIDTGADRALICNGVIDEEDYVAALARHLGLAFEAIDRLPRAACPLDAERLIGAAAAGLLPLDLGGNRVLAVAPDGLAARRLMIHFRSGGELANRIFLTTPASLRAFVARHAESAIARRAAEALRTSRPDLSAGAGRPRTALLIAAAIALLLGLSMVPGLLANVLDVALALVFLGWTALRLVGILAGEPPKRRSRPPGDDRLPVYTILVALYREAKAVEGLVAALAQSCLSARESSISSSSWSMTTLKRRPRSRAMRLGPPFEIVFAPRSGPRTKPKALNAALPFARGVFTAVFDAEDRPEPEQLRLALQAFHNGDAVSPACRRA